MTDLPSSLLHLDVHQSQSHKTWNIAFTLVINDFGVKYSDQCDVEHLMGNVGQDWKGKQYSKYCGLTLEWDYENHTCDISIPGYIEHALQWLLCSSSTNETASITCHTCGKNHIMEQKHSMPLASEDTSHFLILLEQSTCEVLSIIKHRRDSIEWD